METLNNQTNQTANQSDNQSENHSTSPANDNSVLLVDGLVTFRIKQPDGSEKKIDVDALILKLTTEECERECGLKTNEKGMMEVNARFLANLADKLGEIGFESCSPTIAYQVWLAVGDAMATLKKSMNGTPK